jgi:ABC-2 type transport system permease protein
LPKALVVLNNFLPFRYIVWFPIQVFTGKIEYDLAIFLPALIWVVVIYGLAVIVYNKGIERYEGFGA